MDCGCGLRLKFQLWSSRAERDFGLETETLVVGGGLKTFIPIDLSKLYVNFQILLNIVQSEKFYNLSSSYRHN